MIKEFNINNESKESPISDGALWSGISFLIGMSAIAVAVHIYLMNQPVSPESLDSGFARFGSAHVTPPPAPALKS